MARVVALVAVLALALTGGALADHLEPQKQVRPADQKRARAMLLRVSDLPAGYRVERTSGLEPHLTCEALDESDLTVTGTARSPYWARDLRIVGSASAVYRSEGDSMSAWVRGTSAAGLRCLRATFTTALGERLQVSLRKLRIPRVARESAAYRMVLSGAQPAAPRFFLDHVLLKHGRAQSALVFASLLAAPSLADEVALARVVGRRMASAMRGA